MFGAQEDAWIVGLKLFNVLFSAVVMDIFRLSLAWRARFTGLFSQCIAGL